MAFVPVDINKIKLDQPSTGKYVPVDINAIQLDEPQENGGFFSEMGANFEHGIRSAEDLLSGNYQDIGRTLPTPKTQALADKLFPAGSDGSFMGAVRNVGNTSASDWSGALLEKFGETPEGKALAAIGGLNPVYNAAGTAFHRYINPAITEVTGIHPDNLALTELVFGATGVKKAGQIKDPNIAIAKAAINKVRPLMADERSGVAATVRPSAKPESASPMQKVYARLRADYPDEAEFNSAINSYASKQGKTLLEAGGERTANLAEGAAMYTSGGARANEFFKETVGAAPEKLKTTLSKTVSDKVNYYDTLDNIVAEGRKSAKPIYESAYKANPSIRSKVIDKILATPEGRDALGEAVKNIQNEMSTVGVRDKQLTAMARELSDLGLMQKQKSGVASGLKLSALDQVKRAMDQTINRAYRSGDEAQAQRIVNLKSALVREIDAADKSGLYKKARSVSGDYLSNRDAMESGLRFLTEDAEIVARDFVKMGAAEKNAYRVGVLKAIRNNIDNRYDGHNVARVFDKPATRRKLRSILSERDFNKLMEDAKTTDNIFKLRNQITGNSRTTPRKIAAEEFEAMGQDVIVDLVTGSPTRAGVKVLTNFIRKKFDGLNDKSAGEVADILFETDPKKKYQIVRQLANEARNQAPSPKKELAKIKLDAFYSLSDAIVEGRSTIVPGVASSEREPLRLTITPSDKGGR